MSKLLFMMLTDKIYGQSLFMPCLFTFCWCHLQITAVRCEGVLKSEVLTIIFINQNEFSSITSQVSICFSIFVGYKTNHANRKRVVSIYFLSPWTIFLGNYQFACIQTFHVGYCSPGQSKRCV